MSFLGKTIFVMSILSGALLFTGCDEQQLRQIDEIVQDANAFAEGTEIMVTQTPAGAAMPVSWKLIALLGTNIVSSLAFAWQRFRTGQVNTKYVTMKAAQAEFALVNPEAEKQLYAINGVKRIAQGVK